MNPFDPFNLFHLAGVGTMRNITLALPIETVRSVLPHGLELGPQQMTPPGTHPVIMGFHDMFRLHTSIPTLLPSMTYHEHSVGIPYCYVTPGMVAAQTLGPYYFMPILFLDNLWAALGGILFWGYAKQVAAFCIDRGRFSIRRPSGEPLLSLSYEGVGEPRPIADYPYFELQRQVISQPLVSMVPVGLGPFFVIAGFPKKWDVARVRPLRAVIDVSTEYVAGLSSARYPSAGQSPGIDASAMGAYELYAPFQVGSPYPPMPPGV
jgi:hypothetical protein